MENYAYSFIHDDMKEVFKNMKFDVIIGNPPYQMDIGNKGANSFKAVSIYHLFVTKAIELNPKYISMVIPSRWMTKSVSGIPVTWIDKMIDDQRLKEIHDFRDSSTIFSGVNIGGGVNYFLWDNEYKKECSFHEHNSDNNTKSKMYYGDLNAFKSGVVMRDLAARAIVEKVIEVEGNYVEDLNNSFYSMVSPKDYFCNEGRFTSTWKDYSENKIENNDVQYYISGRFNDVEIGWVRRKHITRNEDAIKYHKVYIAAAGSFHEGSTFLGVPRYGSPNSICSQTYLVIGYNHDLTEDECMNIIRYIKTKFFRFMVSIKKQTQNGARGVYQFVPLQDFNKSWTDEELYKKYNLTKDEISHIEHNIAPMGEQDIDEADPEDYAEDFDEEE